MLADTSTFKICLVGPTGAGKTTLTYRLVNEQFKEDIKPTLGACYSCLRLKTNPTNLDATLNIWDTAGQEAFRSIVPIYYSDVDVFFLVYDLTKQEQIEELRGWLAGIEERVDPKKSLKYLIGCKKDLATPENLADIRKQAKSFADSTECLQNIETSAKTGEGVQLLLCALAEDLDPQSEKGSSVLAQRTPERFEKPKKCCN